ncbi:MAG: SpoIIE family protein phosphatase [Actinomycetota bacterium]|nr:SpoIIE family protein phosphatase [Actinomycetota bacterium]
MGAAMAVFDWARTPLGPVADWPQSLRSTVNLCLTSRAPMMVVWGPQHVQLYNDALAPLMGPKHPSALGRPYAESFPEIWDDVMAPLLVAALERGEASHLEDVPVFFHRRVPNEEMFWTFSWSPLRDERGRLAGALHPAVETTGRVLAERRTALLRDLATSVAQAAGVQQACERTVGALADHVRDTPVCGLYLLDEHPGAGVPVAARLVAAGGLVDVAAVFPAQVDLTNATFTPWPLAAAAAADSSDGGLVATPLELDPSVLRPASGAPTTGVVLPLTRPGHRAPLGLLAVGLNPSRPLDDAQASFLQLLGGQLSAALATAALHEQQYAVAVTLQRSLLPDVSRGSSEVETAARYLPGSTGAAVGGDWYDVVPLGAGRTALVIGDVMGHGVPAAAVMGQLRAAVRAYAQLDLPPERILDLLDQLVEHISEAQDVGQIVTCIYAVHDSGDATLTLASAGHPAAVVGQGGRWRLWHGPVGPPLGTGGGGYAATSQPLPAGAGLVLYTDGLVERRGRDLDVGLDQLLVALRTAGDQDLERLADAALAVRDRDQHDDIAVLAVRVSHTALPPPVVVSLHGDRWAARTARRLAAQALSGWGITGTVADDAVLLASELVNNAVTHTGRPRRLRVRRLVDRLVLEVSDADPRPPQRSGSNGPHGGDGGEEGGRGLVILDALASGWGVRFDGTGKVVWCEVALSAS